MPFTCEETDSLLLDFAEGDLDDAQSDEIRRHVRACPECAARLRALRDLVGALSMARSLDNRAATLSSDTIALPKGFTAATPTLAEYEILGEIGRGGMGVVYRAQQKSLNRVVALKVLSAAIAASERAVARFRMEAQAAARLHHTNIVPVYAQGQEGECFYYAMELIEGLSLSRVLHEAPSLVGGAAPPAEQAPDLAEEAHASLTMSRVSPRRTRDFKRIASMLAGVADGLHHAHEQGIIHRDIKPQNLLLGKDGQLHITDFGLARLLDEPGVTMSSEMVGTPAYMAPEQISGQPVTRATDVFSLGVVMYEMLTHARPFEGRTYDQVIHNVLKSEPRRPRKRDPHIPIDLETICLRALEKEPLRRFASAADMARDLRRYAEDFPIASRRIGPVGRALRWVRRNKAKSAAISAIALAAALAPLAAHYWLSLRQARADRIVRDATDILLADYRSAESVASARQVLGSAFVTGVDTQRARLVEAFSWILQEPQRSIDLLEPLAQRADATPDVHTLLAWAYRRRGHEGDASLSARALARADEPPQAAALSAEGHFFRGMALSTTDPRAAELAFREAKKRRPNFAQAMLHQARAYNWILYLSHSRTDYNEYYLLARDNLSSLINLEENPSAYTRYLLSVTHRLGAEIRRADNPQAAREAYEACHRAALDAQRAEAASPRGYVAEAEYYESLATTDFDLSTAERMRLLRQALAARNRLDDPNIKLNPSDFTERAAYQMRLHFWLGEFDAALEWCRRLYESVGDRAAPYSPEQTLYEVTLNMTRGDARAARDALASGRARAGRAGEAHLLLSAVGRLLSDPPPLVSDESFSNPASPSWTRAWLLTLLRYERGEATWNEVLSAAETETSGKMDAQNRMAGAWLIRGLKALARGDRHDALQSFRAGAESRDGEHYCFASKMLLFALLDERLPRGGPEDDLLTAP